ncbi:hypothetical protein D9M71_624760 [compost metagenome]
MRKANMIGSHPTIIMRLRASPFSCPDLIGVLYKGPIKSEGFCHSTAILSFFIAGYSICETKYVLITMLLKQYSNQARVIAAAER